MSQPHHTIQSVSRRTGLSPHVIRIWEKRYGAVKPNRTDSNRRLYSETEIKRLQRLRRATEAGHSIGTIALLEDARLEELSSHAPEPQKKIPAPRQNKTTEEFIRQCITATQQLDAVAFEETLHHASVSLGQHGLVEQVIGPVAEAIGDLWRDGTITAAHEHFASAAIRVFLGHAARPFALPANAPQLVVATPAGQLHELGAVMVAATATDLGWRVMYLGTSLPAAEIAGASTQHQVRAVALSIVYPDDDEQLPEELHKLRRYLPSDVKIIIGGRAAASYDEAIKRIGATHSGNLTEFCDQLNSLRTQAKRRKPSS
jgi:methylmalonyl-CoA mutase cobalamin-binding domain/chain